MSDARILTELDELDARIRGDDVSAAMAALARKTELLRANPNVRRKRASARRQIRDQRAAEVESERRRAYEAYINSPEWKRRRAVAIRKAGERCQLCNRADDLHVHHRTYERFGAEMEDDLTVLCAKCHERFHGTGSEDQATAA